MADLDTLQKENKNLKDLLEQVYETSFISDMISDLKKADLKVDENQLIHLLILRQDIEKALSKPVRISRKLVKELGSQITDDSLKLRDVAKLTRHLDPAFEKYYEKAKD